MDIRNFFGPAGGKKSKNSSSTQGKETRTGKSAEPTGKPVKRKNSHEDKTPKKQKDSEKEKKRKRQIESTPEEEEPKVDPKQKRKSKKVQRVIESDSDEDPVPVAKPEKKKKKEAVIFVDDSDEEEKKPARRSSLDNFVIVTPPKPKTKTPEKKTPVNVSDFFGSSCVHRSDRKTAAVKRKISTDTSKSEDLELHDDEDFAKTLSQLDEEIVPKKARTGSPEKVNGEGLKSLSGKLSSRMKTVVEDTPEKPEKKVSVVVPDTPVTTKKSPLKNPSPKKGLPKSTMVFTPKKSPEKKADSKKVSPASSSSPSPKKVSPKAENAAGDTPKLVNRTSYRNYLHRQGPSALGSKEIPEGEENCLEGLTFVITGVLESMERDEAKSLVEKYGGKVTGSISKKTSYVVIGRDAGESKLKKAEQFKTTQLDEDGLLNLIRSKPGKKSKYVEKAEEDAKKEMKEKAAKEKLSKFKSEENNNVSHKLEKRPSASKPVASSSSPKKKSEMDLGETLMWVDKYKPTNVRQIIGQQGDKSNAKKLLNWLKSWHHHRIAGTKPQGKFFGGSNDGAGLRAALLSGPPGIGKTTTATLVCQEVDFSYVELNASDTRSKRSLKQVVAESLNNTTLVDFMDPSKADTGGHKHCIIMDEVDGMAGNEDRGGIQELVQLVKQTKIPVICICNDRNHQKMRTLANYCFDLRFYKPRVEQIKGAMMSIIFKEGLKVPPPAVNEIIMGANQDIRQVIHNLSMWSAADKGLTYEQAKRDAKKAEKDFKIGPFDVCRKVFVGGEETAGMSLDDKSDLFFQDYSFTPLFVQENYINVTPFSTRGSVGKHLSALARTADSIASGDLVDRKIRSQQAWNLLPTQAFYASVIPGELMRGSFPHMVQFPSWLGKNSSRTKNDRILQELRTHMRLQISGDLRSLNLDYLPAMRAVMTEPLVQHGADGVRDVINFMDNYDIIKEDFDNILEVSKWPNSSDPLSKLDTKTKSAFTRTYNKEAHMTPYATGVMTKKRRGKAPIEEDDDLMGVEDRAAMQADSSEDEDDLEADTMIKKGAAEKGKKGSNKQNTEVKGKGKGGGKGRGKGKGRS